MAALTTEIEQTLYNRVYIKSIFDILIRATAESN